METSHSDTATLSNNAFFNLSIPESSDPSELGGLEQTESTHQMSNGTDRGDFETSTTVMTSDVEDPHVTDVATEQTSDATSSLSSLPDHTSSTTSELVTELTTAPDDPSLFETSSLPSSSTLLPMLDFTTLTTAEPSSVVPERSALTIVTKYLTFSDTIFSPCSKPMRTRRTSRLRSTTTVT